LWPGEAWHGRAGRGRVRHELGEGRGLAGSARHGMSLARGEVWLDGVRLGGAWRGVRQGSVR